VVGLLLSVLWMTIYADRRRDAAVVPGSVGTASRTCVSDYHGVVMSRRLSILLLLALGAVTLALAGCGGGNSSNKASTSAQTTPTGPTGLTNPTGPTGTRSKKNRTGTKKQSKTKKKRAQRTRKKTTTTQTPTTTTKTKKRVILRPPTRSAEDQVSFDAAKEVCRTHSFKDIDALYKPKSHKSKDVATAVASFYHPRHRLNAAYKGCLAGLAARK
jgi:hypothetical protein